MTRQCSGPGRRVRFLRFESRRGAGSAIDRHYVMVPWRVIFFGVNLTACLGWIALTTQFFAGESDLSIFGLVLGAIMASPAIAVALAEWLLFARRMPRLERPLGIVAGLVGALALFALVVNAGEALVNGGSPNVLFWLGFGSICLAISAYGFWCCWLRVRRQTLPQSHGFPVGQAAAP